MKTTGIMVGVLLLTAVGANAALTGTSLKLQIDTVTGQAYLVSTVAETIPLFGYYIRNATGKATLIPDAGTYDFSHWVGLSTYASTGHSDALVPGIVDQTSGWSPLINTTSYLGEGNPGSVSVLVGHGRIPIGHITTSTTQSDFSTTAAFKWQYAGKYGTFYTLTNNAIEFVPEPATLGLVALGGLAAIRRRR